MATAALQEAKVRTVSVVDQSVPLRRRTAGFAGLATASFLGCIDLTIVSAVLPSVTRELGTSIDVSQLVLSGFLTALAMFMVTAGRLGDRFGRRRVLLVGLVVFVVASAVAALAPSIGWLIAARFVQGGACAVLYTCTSTLVEQLFAVGERGRAVGWLYAVNGVGLAIGPVLGAVLAPPLGWGSVFWLNVPLGVLAYALIRVSVPAPEPDTQSGMDLPGQALLAIAVAGAVAFVSLPQSSGWLSVPVVTAAAAAAAAGAVLVTVERRADDPLLSIALFAHPRFRVALLSDFFLAAFYASALLVLPPYLADGHGLSERAVGLSLLAVSATMALASAHVGRWVDRSGPQTALRYGFGALIVTAVIVVIAGLTGSLVVLLAGFVCFGLGWALILAPATVAALSSVPKGQSGFAVGASWTFHNLGGALGAAVAAGLYTPSNASHGLLRVAVILVATSLVALTANLAITNRTGARS